MYLLIHMNSDAQFVLLLVTAELCKSFVPVIYLHFLELVNWFLIDCDPLSQYFVMCSCLVVAVLIHSWSYT
ncbi:hypothetical protein RIF29_18595 [Crotalaria pallida]|uniref:Uncharacterized protein n=1 Tax=Crotalaria pallida TaxID=3830 RepID=A0AAN9I6Y8_CROPI